MVFLDFWLIKLLNSRKMPYRKPAHPQNCLGKYYGITVKLSVSSITVFGSSYARSRIIAFFNASSSVEDGRRKNKKWRWKKSKVGHSQRAVRNISRRRFTANSSGGVETSR